MQLLQGTCLPFILSSMGVERAGVAHIIKLLVVDMAAAPWDCLVGRAIITIARGRGCAQGQLLHFRRLRGAEQAAGCLLGGGACVGARCGVAGRWGSFHCLSVSAQRICISTCEDDAINSCSLWGLDRPRPDS